MQNRRRFLRETTAALAGTALASSRVLGANDRIRLGAIGTGGRARKSLIPIHKNQPDTEIVALCDVYEPNLLRTVTEDDLPKARQLRDYRAILDDKSIDAVVIGTPDHWHARLVREAVAAGKDVYVEKPVTHTLDEGAELIRAVEASGRIVQIGMQQRSWAHFIEGKQLLDAGRLGQVTAVRMWWYQNYAASGHSSKLALDKLDRKMWLGKAPAQEITPIKFYWWRWFWDFGGGALTDLMCHWIDVVQWYLNAPAPTSALAAGNRFVLDWECPDTITCVLDYPQKFSATYTGTMVSSIEDGGLEIRGTKAAMKLNRAQLAIYNEDGPSRGRELPAPPDTLLASKGDGTVSHIRNFLDCVRSRKAPNAGIRVAVEAARAAHLGNLALRRDRRVRWNDSQARVEG